MLPVAYHCIVVYDDLVIALDGDVLDGVHLVGKVLLSRGIKHYLNKGN